MPDTVPHTTLDPRDFGRRLQLLAKAWRREIDLQMGRYGLTEAKWRPLLLLGQFGEGIRQTDLAGMLGIEGPSLVPLIDALERAGLVERCDVPEDRRSKLLRMTAAGAQLHQRVALAYSSAVRHLLHNVDEADLAACHRLFRTIERNIAHPASSIGADMPEAKP